MEQCIDAHISSIKDRFIVAYDVYKSNPKYNPEQAQEVDFLLDLLDEADKLKEKYRVIKLNKGY